MNSARNAVLKAGAASEEEFEEQVKAWEAWEENEEGRFILVDGAVVCWK
jgi:hypothetical protein